MSPLISILAVAVVAWRVFGFVAAYRRGKSAAADRKTEREQQEDWARRMRGGGKGDK